MTYTNYFLQASSGEESEEETPQQKTKTPARRTSVDYNSGHKKSTRSTSSESSSSTEASTGSSNAVRNTGAPFTTEEVKQKYLSRGSIDHTADPPTPATRTRVPSTGSNSGKETPAPKPFQSRFLNKSSTPAPVTKEEEEEETETSSEEETESEEESEDNTPAKPETKEIAKSDIGPLLARSALARDNSSESSRKSSRDETTNYTPRSRYTAPPKEDTPPSTRYTRTRPIVQEEEPPARYGYTSRFLNKSKSSAVVPPDDDDHTSRYSSTLGDDDSKYPSGRSR